MSQANTPAESPHLLRRFGLLQATALNMSNMIGIGPFITIPLLMSAVNGGGPQAMLGWILGVIIAISDGLIWSELGAAFPGSGGSYLYLREAFGRATLGRLMGFLFIWQFIFSGPLEIASGYIGFIQYFSYLWPGMSPNQGRWIMVALGVANIALLYRQIGSIGKLTVSLWIGSILTTLAVIGVGATHFNPKIAFDFPPGAFGFSTGFIFGLGAATRIGLYDYLGYYDICYIGDEVKEPRKTIPRSIILSIVLVAIIYMAMNLSVIGVVPWREFVPAENNPKAQYVVSLFMEQICGKKIAFGFTLMVLWTTFASCFALLLGYSRIPYAAAIDGCFFKIFGRVHGEKRFPHFSLVVIGLIAIACAFLPLDSVISALLVSRILVQFIGQIVGVFLLRKNRPEALTYRMALYPLPAIVALVGWLYIFATTDLVFIGFGLGAMIVGIVAYLVWAQATRQWPFTESVKPSAGG
ncbi:MAG TPA: APC family permease [Candidatus Limnocylindria bacterium]|jgi:amino acid transporter|nr:APC family permease [Candidatus Limnocylindria bacterium]